MHPLLHTLQQPAQGYRGRNIRKMACRMKRLFSVASYGSLGLIDHARLLHPFTRLVHLVGRQARPLDDAFEPPAIRTMSPLNGA